jgi:hypothetical protein
MVGTAFGTKGSDFKRHRQAPLFKHGLQHGICAQAKIIGVNFQGDVAIPEMVSGL